MPSGAAGCPLGPGAGECPGPRPHGTAAGDWRGAGATGAVARPDTTWGDPRVGADGGLVERWYELQVCEGPVEAEPFERVEAYRVVGLSPHQASPGRRSVHPLSRFVGRDREMAILHALLAQLEDGHGHVVGIAGEPGIGKSRLIYEFRRTLTEGRLTYWPGRCFSYDSATPICRCWTSSGTTAALLMPTAQKRSRRRCIGISKRWEWSQMSGRHISSNSSVWRRGRSGSLCSARRCSGLAPSRPWCR